ncbi:MAG: S8 family serine peptidase [Eubacterium sp.]|nr:S8 family serine peptidase [Eubacterium sp.]
MKRQIKKLTSVTLAVTMMVSLCSANIVRSTTAKADVKTVFDEIAEVSISEKKLDEIAEVALEDGEKAAKTVNDYENDADYNAALNSALTSYYDTEDFEQLDEFQNTVDSRSDEVVEAYEEAAEERDKGDKNGYEAGKVVAIFDGEATEEEIHAVCEAQNGEIESMYKDFIGDYVAEISISLGQTVDMASEAYSQYSITEAVDSNDYYDVEETALKATNDPDINKQYYLDNVHVKEAWDYVSSHTHDKVLVGVIDTGVQVDHPDLENVLSPYSADVTGSTPVLLTECEEPAKHDHGTGVASIIAAEANNNRQMAGVASCYNNDVVEILAVQASTYSEERDDYVFELENQLKALNYCFEQGVRVVNMSLGGYFPNNVQEHMINKMTDTGIIVVCSAGNNSVGYKHYPSDYEKCISVISTDSRNNMSEFSNFGPHKDICAPGTSVFMLNKNSGTWYGSGTSMASPVVAAVAAMMCSINADLNYFDVKRIMANTATDLAEDISKDKVPYGIVNAAKSVQYAVDYTPNTLFKFELEPYQNLAYKKNVTASSLYNSDDFPITNLVDGDTRSKIITGSSAGQYVEVDLGEVCDIDKINLIYDRYSTTAYSIKVSENHEEWIEIDSGEKEPQTGKLLEFEKQKARYVKVDFIDNDTYVVLLELEVYGYIQEPIQYKDILNEKEKPSDVLNMTANWIFPGAVRIAWEEDANRASKDYTYNIYINDRLSRSQITETSEIITDLRGTYTFKVTACLNGYESEGVEIRTYVGNTMPTTTTEVAPTTPVPTTPTPTTTPVPTTEAPTTPVPTTTTVEKELLEVIGMVASCPADNTIGVVWGQDADRINSGCKYNVYVNDVKVLSEVICNYYVIDNVDAGNVNVKVTATLNGKETAGVTQMVNVTGNEDVSTTPVSTTEVPTTTEMQTTTEVPTSVVPGKEPLEVIGMVTSCPADNTVGVVWGQDEERMNSGCKYNVYINGEKILNEVVCAYYTIENISAGQVTVKVTSVLNGIESPGVVQNVNVLGTALR